MKQGFLTILAVALAVQVAIAQQPLALDITLGNNEVSAFNIASLFAQATAENKLITKKKAQKNIKTSLLGQQLPTYTASHHAAYIQDFGQISHALSGLSFTKEQTVDAYTYDSVQNFVSMVVQGTYYRLKYDQTLRTFSLNYTVEVVPGTTCTGFDATSQIAVVGCLDASHKNATLYSIKDGKLVEGNLTINFSENQEILGGLKIDISTKGDELVVFDDVYKRSSETDPQEIVLYFVSVNDDTGALTFNNVVTSIKTEDGKVVKFNQLSDVYILASDNTLAYVSGAVNGTGVQDVYVCSVLIEEMTKVASFLDCHSLQIAKAGVTNGKARYFPGLGLPFVLVFDADTNSVWQCLNAGEEEGYIDCVKTIRSLPFDRVASNVYVSFTAFSSNLAVTFRDTETGQIWMIANLMRYDIDEETQALEFDQVIEANPKAIMALERRDVTVLFSETFKSYGRLNASNWMLQITANDLPEPSGNSDVPNKRLLIKVTRDSPEASIWVRVVVMSAMNSIMGFSDFLPDFGGITGGYSIANMDRSWLYGNDLSLTVESSALDKPSLVDRSDFEFTHNDSVVFTKLFVQHKFLIVAQDNSKLYYYTCKPSNSNSNACEQQHSFDLPVGTEIKRVFDSTSHPDVLQSHSTIVLLQDKDMNSHLYFIWRRDVKQSALVDLKVAARDVYVINNMETLLIFYAPVSGENAKNVVVKSTFNSPAHFQELSDVTVITPEFVGLPAESTFAPSNIISCGHNDYVIEYLSGTGYIVKLNVYGTDAKGIALRANVRIVNPQDPTFVAAGFCPMGDEFIVWDKEYSSIFSTSTITDNTAFFFGLETRGVHRIYAVNCAQRSGTVGIWGQNNNFDKVVTTIFGNQFNAAHTKIHSIEMLAANTAVDFTGTYSMTPSTVAQVSISEGKTYIKNINLGGPYLLYGIKDQINDPTLRLTITSGGETRKLDYQLNIAQVDKDVRIGEVKQNITLDKGDLNLEDAAEIIGHVDNVTLQDVPESLKDVVTLQQRLAPVASQASEGVAEGSAFSQILDSNSNYSLLLKTSDDGNLTLSVRGSITKDTYTSFTGYTSIDGFLDEDYAVVSILWKSGGAYAATMYYIPLDKSGEATTRSARLTSGYLETIKVIRVPGANPTYALFTSMKMANQCMVYRTRMSDTTIDEWDTITNCFNLWTIRSERAGLAFFNTLKDTQLNLYLLEDATVAKGTIQSGITFSGSNNEFRDISCVNYDKTFLECAAVTWGPTNLHFKANFTEEWQIPVDEDGNPVIVSRSLFNYADGTDVSGSYIQARIVRGYVLLKSLDHTYELYKTDDASQGYVYARVPSARSAAARGLGYSVAHDLDENERDFHINSDGNSTSIIRLNKASAANAEGLEAFSVQPLVLRVTSELNDESAKSIKISLGSSAQPATFNVTDFFQPKPPVPPVPPAPEEKKKLTWLWILLGIVALAVIVVILIKVLGNRKEFGAEDDAYNKNEPFVEDDAGSLKKRKNSDEFN